MENAQIDPEVQRRLEELGWTAERDMSEEALTKVQVYVANAAAQGVSLTPPPAAIAALRNLLGLQLDYSTEDYWYFPLAELRPPVVSSTVELRNLLEENVLPIGFEQPENGIIAVDEQGRFFLMHHTGHYFLGSNRADALNRYFRNVRPEDAEDFAPEVRYSTAASLLINGRIYSQTLSYYDETPDLYPTIRRFIDERKPEFARKRLECSADIALVSDQFWGLASTLSRTETISLDEAKSHFEGSTLILRMMNPGQPDHGRAVDPLPVAAALLETLSIKVVPREE